jgi:hypothetical protein
MLNDVKCGVRSIFPGIVTPEESNDRYVWSAAELQAKNEEWQLVCANVFGL